MCVELRITEVAQVIGDLGVNDGYVLGSANLQCSRTNAKDTRTAIVLGRSYLQIAVQLVEAHLPFVDPLPYPIFISTNG